MNDLALSLALIASTTEARNQTPTAPDGANTAESLPMSVRSSSAPSTHPPASTPRSPRAEEAEQETRGRQRGTSSGLTRLTRQQRASSVGYLARTRAHLVTDPTLLPGANSAAAATPQEAAAEVARVLTDRRQQQLDRAAAANHAAPSAAASARTLAPA